MVPSTVIVSPNPSKNGNEVNGGGFSAITRRRSLASATKRMSTAPALWVPFRRLAA
jgi:hypothetical protein